MHSIFTTLVGFSTVIFLIHIAVCFGLTVGLDRKKIGRKMQLHRFLGYFYPIFCLGFGIFSLIGQRWGEAILLLGLRYHPLHSLQNKSPRSPNRRQSTLGLFDRHWFRLPATKALPWNRKGALVNCKSKLNIATVPMPAPTH